MSNIHTHEPVEETGLDWQNFVESGPGFENSSKVGCDLPKDKNGRTIYPDFGLTVDDDIQSERITNSQCRGKWGVENLDGKIQADSDNDESVGLHEKGTNEEGQRGIVEEMQFIKDEMGDMRLTMKMVLKKCDAILNRIDEFSHIHDTLDQFGQTLKTEINLHTREALLKVNANLEMRIDKLNSRLISRPTSNIHYQEGLNRKTNQDRETSRYSQAALSEPKAPA